jgi:DNA-binding transcriptional ArsR family regulator
MPDDWNNGLESEPVTTYVSPDTKEVWKKHADELGMSLSRFIESMVNAGRAEYAETAPEGYEDDPVSARREADALKQKVETLEGREEFETEAVEVYAALDGEYVTVTALAEKVEEDEPSVYEALQRLLEEELVEYDTMRNAYRRTE